MNQNILNRLAIYKNSELIDLFLARDGRSYSRDQANELFDELKKLLYLLYLIEIKHSSIHFFNLTSDLDAIDKLWHQFILMTQDYANFCNEVFEGIFIHHEPNPNSKKYIDSKSIMIREQIYFIEKIWGEETVIKWYHIIPNQDKYIHSIWRKIWK